MKSILNHKGFTLVEIMITMGIVGVIGIAAMFQLKSSNQTVGSSKVISESSFLKNLVIANMANPIACNNTFATKSNVRPDTAIETLFNLMDRNNSVFLRVGQTFEDSRLGSAAAGKSIFTITSIKATPTPRTTKSVTITVGYSIDKTLEKSSIKTENSFNVDVYVYQKAGVVISCFFDAAGMIRRAVEASCFGNSARYSPGTGDYGECFHEVQVNQGAAVTSAGSLCPAGEALYAATTNTTDATASPGKVNYKCRPVNTNGPACATGFYMVGINPANGAPICTELLSLYSPATNGLALTVTNSGYQEVDLNCPTNQVLTRLNPKTCVPKVIIKTCPAGQYIKTVDGYGNVTCATYTQRTGSPCPAGTYAHQMYPDGTIPAGACLPLTLNANCGGNSLTAVDSNGIATWCQ